MSEDKDKDEEKGGDEFGGDDFFEDVDFETEGFEDLPEDSEEASRIRQAIEGVVPDILKRTFSAGLRGASVSEERIREVLTEREGLPKEVVAYLLRRADSTKKEMLRIVSKEVRDFLENMDFGGEVAKILTSLSLEARIEVRFKSNEESVNRDSVRPKASGKVRVKRSESGEDDEDTSDGTNDADETPEPDEGSEDDE